MSQVSWGLKAAAVIVLAAGFTIAHAADDDAYVVTPLVSSLAGSAPKVDPVLQNAWGVAFSPAGSPFWVNDNATGCSTLYDGQGAKVALQVSIPLPGNVIPASSCHPVSSINPPNPAPAAPTGIVWNPSPAFLVPGTRLQAAFIFATENGTLSAWAGGLNPADRAVLAADNSSTPSAANGAVYKGLVFGVNAKGPFLFATNFRSGRIDVFGPNGANGMFTPATTDGGFIDPRIPAGYAPFGIANIDGDLFVTYAQQDDQKHDDVAGNGHGFVDVFDTDGHLLRRFASQGTLNSPWGVTRASFAFGRFSGKILIGNFGDGRIGVFDDNGRFVEQLENAAGNPLAIDGLWMLTLGGGRNSSPDTLYFTAGPNKEADGLFGTIAPLNGAKAHRSDQNEQ
ncbi:TIGR03118 family protein [Burkholderia ubonensis]|uniref:TIGR03118 family protein n=1 Tax=Burkholderia ubonensis TaxID=101571 RepID=UPI00016A66ED|nr:TIGR03118 family protein [Burkholderia ubonensis]